MGTTQSTCSLGRSNNPPAPFSHMTLSVGGSAPTYLVQDGYDADKLAGLKFGIDVIRSFLGSVEASTVVAMETGGSAGDYATVTKECSALTHENAPGFFHDPCPGAAEKAEKEPHGGFWVSPVSACYKGCHTKFTAPVFSVSSPSTSKRELAERAIHEYTHVVQAAFGEPVPAWTLEGGAVLMECLMTSRLAASGQFDQGEATFSDCMTNGGGRGGVVKNLRKLYQKDLSIKWLSDFGTDWGTTEDPPPAGVPPGLEPGPEDSWIYYDTGAYAMAFAIIKANEKHTMSGGRTFVDMWQSQGTKGFWHAIEPVESDPVTGWPSMVKEGTGWKKALTEFTGYGTAADFFAAFEDHVAPNGVLKSEAELLAFLNASSLTNAKVNELNMKAASFTDFKKRVPKTQCGAGLGRHENGGYRGRAMVWAAVAAACAAVSIVWG